MSVPILALSEKIITDRGEVVYRHSGLIRKLIQNDSLEGVIAHTNDDVKRMIASGVKLIEWSEGEPEGIPENCFEWNIPQSYLDLDWIEYCGKRLEDGGFGPSYERRFLEEVDLAIERGMDDFIRTIIYVVETAKENRIVLGVGRGSACASLIMYLIGVHRVDPVEYEIPVSEFFK